MAAPVRPRPLPHPRPAAADTPEANADAPPPTSPSGTDRRRFLSYLVAAPTLVVAARLGIDAVHSNPAGASIPSLPEPADLFDLGDLQDLAASPTSGLISIIVNTDGTASFALPRAEVGQGITTAITMLIADEMELPMDKVIVTFADCNRPELDLEPAHRRLQLHPLDVHAGACTAAAGARAAASCIEHRGRAVEGAGLVDH